MMTIKLHQKIFKIIEELCKKYENLTIPKETITDFIWEKALDNSEEYSKLSDENLLITISFELKIFIHKYLETKFDNQEINLMLITDYINDNFKENAEYQTLINQFDKLTIFVDGINYAMTKSVIRNIIKKNNTINMVLKKIVEENITLITENQRNNIFYNELLANFIEVYCDIRNITIKKDEYINEEYESETIDEEYSGYEEDILKIYLKEITTPILTPAEEQFYGLKNQQGDKSARDILIQRNLRLVIKIANKYVDKGLDIADLIQEGNLGLIKAVDNFDVNKGVRFSTYATWWIKQFIRRALRECSRTIRIPSHVHDKISVYHKTMINLEKKLQRSVNKYEIANAMGITIKEVDELEQAYLGTSSLNTPIGEEEDSELIDMIDNSEQTPEELMLTQELSLEIRALLENSNLTDTELQIIILRFGLDRRGIRTLEETGKYLNMSRERVRQLEAKAICKFRNSNKIKQLSSYLDNPEEGNKNIDVYRHQYAEDSRNRTKLLKKTKK